MPFLPCFIHLNLLLAMSSLSSADTLVVKKTEDFIITGQGNDPAWQQTDWVILPFRHSPPVAQQTRAKVLYSETGLYFLFACEDEKITATLTEDFADLFNEDVVEVFLWTDERFPVYFEYELSPLDHELPLLVPNFEGQFLGWLPWHYTGDRRTRHATHVTGGEKASGASIQQWNAEFFIPYTLLAPLNNVPPQKGTAWRANLYRIDYDSGTFRSWQWQPIEKRFHEYEKFGTFLFE